MNVLEELRIQNVKKLNCTSRKIQSIFKITSNDLIPPRSDFPPPNAHKNTLWLPLVYFLFLLNHKDENKTLWWGKSFISIINLSSLSALNGYDHKNPWRATALKIYHHNHQHWDCYSTLEWERIFSSYCLLDLFRLLMEKFRNLLRWIFKEFIFFP